MRLSFKLLGSVTLALCLAGAALSIGCASEPAAEDDAASSSDITGSLGNARACAIEKAYLAAGVGDFTMLKKEDLPFNVYTPVDYLGNFASFQVPGVGTIYYAESPYLTDGGLSSDVIGQFYEPTGRVIITSYAQANGELSFFSATTGSGQLSCGTTSAVDASAPHPHPASDGGDASTPYPHPVLDASAHD